MVKYGDNELSIIKVDGKKVLRVCSASPSNKASGLFDAFDGVLHDDEKHCPLTNANAKAILELFPWAKPISHKGRPFTLGLGDRLGLATVGHIRAVRDNGIFPVLAQQSIRELNLTGRTYDDVLADAIWAVFEENYRDGWGADGDHLKTRDEVKMALGSGFTMITLDCSEHIPHGLDAVIKFAVDIYNEFIRGRDIDFELSVDETPTVTTPQDHLYVAEKLREAGVELTSLAPRFCGEFQKGIDYIGDITQFEREFKVHAQIARENGYKLSIHSGSDKFAVFPIIYRETNRTVHVKTAGTNWLEALRVISARNPSLFRDIFGCALANLQGAKQYYHITENAACIPDITSMPDGELPGLLEHNDARQVLHITYGYTLGQYKERIYAALYEFEDDYYAALGSHIGRHI